MIPNNAFDIVFYIKVNQSSTGTCFTLLHNSKRYLITAKHVLGDLKSALNLQIETDSGWQIISYSQIIIPDNQEVDIAAIELDERTLTDLRFVSFKYSTNGILLASDSYFLGYPYGLKNFNIGSQRGKPIIKKSIISGDAYDTSGASIGFILDGHNNPGFSGGPCLSKAHDGNWNLFGVISSYVTQQEILYDKNGRERMIIQENSGIINAHSVDLMIDKL